MEFECLGCDDQHKLQSIHAILANTEYLIILVEFNNSQTFQFSKDNLIDSFIKTDIDKQAIFFSKS